ncbi:hypothetical protein [Mesobacillus stamsii]|uniref:Uncharacterized protein n=1 Tax=Mesobacillus stamsii TaxID=225347 RepID=A0ABU0FY51_9BACI|nr:hypothetical protein [Mesobacillus stamsii]MDQ0414237.1 hypothetical protein [Mesobacillus stamsii]
MGNRSFSNDYLKTFLMCKEFHSLPFDGGYLDQPSVWVEAFEHIQGMINQYEANRKEGAHGK